MATGPAHTPYDGSSKLFAIGLKPLELANWIEVDEHLPFQLGQKRRIYAEHGPHVFVEEPDTMAAQAEVLALLFDYLPTHYPQHYRIDGERLPSRAAPLLGNDTDAILAEAGFDRDEISRLRANGTI